MNNRIQLQKDLEKLKNVKKVYFQPPASKKLVYPCIIYSLARPRDFFGDNRRYIWKPQYTLIIVDPNPDSEIYLEILNEFPYASFDRRYSSNNLYHYVLNLYY